MLWPFYGNMFKSIQPLNWKLEEQNKDSLNMVIIPHNHPLVLSSKTFSNTKLICWLL